ncbi:hypothetical protein K474DRAFT_1754661, partial [Panus rudis PR-1116 ss-1]
RSVITKVVNALTAMSEIGAPMACMYLLKHFDYYTSHNFRFFYWKGYVREVKKSWGMIEDTDFDRPKSEKVVVGKSKGRFIGISKSLDYIHRPHKFEDVSLYDWIRRSEKRKISKKKAAKSDEYDVQEIVGHQWFGRQVQSWKELSKEKTELGKTKQSGKSNDIWERFADEHPQKDTHEVRLRPEQKSFVPNFVGGSLPRPDAGVREEYCVTMLTLFKPWRTGRELKTQAQSWDEAFTKTLFSSRQKELMKFFNIRYECNDARDDFAAQRKAGADGILPHHMENNDFDYADMDNTWVEAAEAVNFDEEHYNVPSRAFLRLISEMTKAEKMLQLSGALTTLSHNILHYIKLAMLKVDSLTAHAWKSLLTAKRDEILNQRESQATTHQTDKSLVASNNSVDAVKIIDQSYLTKKFIANNIDDQKLIDITTKQFSLNEEQERAFRIIANHSVQPSGEQLKMYLGGMAGTGKSQVIKALIHFFGERGEGYRFMCMAPTGAAAALISGSTYHSMLNMGQFSANSVKKLSEVYIRLKNVDYIFIDEISMVDCQALYAICAR